MCYFLLLLGIEIRSFSFYHSAQILFFLLNERTTLAFICNNWQIMKEKIYALTWSYLPTSIMEHFDLLQDEKQSTYHYYYKAYGQKMVITQCELQISIYYYKASTSKKGDLIPNLFI